MEFVLCCIVFGLLLSLLLLFLVSGVIILFFFLLLSFETGYCYLAPRMHKCSSWPGLLSSGSLFCCCIHVVKWLPHSSYLTQLLFSCAYDENTEDCTPSKFSGFVQNSHRRTTGFCPLHNCVFDPLTDTSSFSSPSSSLLAVYTGLSFSSPPCFRFCGSLWLRHSPAVSHNLSIPNPISSVLSFLSPLVG